MSASLILVGALTAEDSPAVHPGAPIFRKQCLDCHGADGQGGDGLERALFGDESIEELALLIERTMPEGEPEECEGDEARQVAEFIYHDFYSPAAREEKGLATAPRIQRMRLTVPQYRNAIADIVGRFTPEPRVGRRDQDEKPGLRGVYYESEKMSKTESRKFERVDERIAFDFGEKAPQEKIDKDQFAIVWQGSIDVRNTGDYEFRIRSPNGVRLYLNLDNMAGRKGLRDDSSDHGQSALIDGWVGSGKMREHHARVFLLGGRRYPIRIEFFKYFDKQASIELTWKPPHGVWGPLDGDNLRTASATRTFVVETPFPADDRSFGYERGTSVSREWHAATNGGAIAVANEVIDRLPILANVDESTDHPLQKLGDFTLEFAKAAWRRPLTDEEQERLKNLFFQENSDPEVATKRAILFLLESPYFLYSDLAPKDESPRPHVVAARLALAVWDSIPDKELMEAADKNELDVEQVREHAERMLKNPRAHAKLHGFFHHWLELGERDRVKDRERYAEFDDAVMADLRRSLEKFVDEVVWSDASDYRQLLLADYLLLNKRLKSLYLADDAKEAAVDGNADVKGEGEYHATDLAATEFEHVVLSNQQRAGVLTHPYLLSALAYHDKTSPIHRGVFLTRNIVGRGLKAPPEAVAFKDEEFASDLTMREKVTQLTSSTTCMSCHSIINPLGFALESYDAVGRWRTTENEKPVDTVSRYLARDGMTVEVRSARDIAEFAIKSQAAQRAFITQLFHHTVKQDPLAYGRGTLDGLRDAFEESAFNIQRLWVEIATMTALAE